MPKKTTAEVKEAVKNTGVKAAEEVKETAGKVADKAAEVKEAVKAETKKVEEKAAEKKAELASEVYVQFGGQEATVDSVIAKATEAYVADGHRASSIKVLKVYLKPEDGAAYYTINDKYAGKVDLF